MATPDETSSFTGAYTSEDEEEVVETLVAGRQKRSTAGRNMSSLLDAAADDDLTLLFAEDENDEEFDEREGGGDAEFDDMRLDSSSEDDDDDDNGPNAAEDDLEGEKELEKQVRVDRKKRKAQESLRLTALRKKVKLDLPTRSSASATTTPRPKKKSERVSWLPTTEEGPVRSSSRRQTMQNKELTHARLKDSEQRRIKLIANMEEAAKRKQRLKPKVMTQEERLAEAAKIERLNSKSLNRWEEMEKRKAEERKAKLEALQNRRLEGPVMSWWSGIAKWVNGKLVRVGNVEVKPKPKPEEKEPDRKKKATKDAATLDAPKVETAESSVAQPLASTETTTANTTIQADGSSGQQQVATMQIQQDKAIGTQGFLDGIHQYASETAMPVPESEPNAIPDQASATVEEVTNETVRADIDQKLEAVDEEVTKDRENTADGKEESNTSTTEARDASESNPADENSAPGVELQADASHPPDVAVEPEKAPEIDPSAENTAQTEDALMDDVDPSTVDDKPPVEASKTDTAPPSLQRTEAADISMHEDISLSGIDQSTSATELVGGQDKAGAEAEVPARPDEIEHTGRNLLVLENFDNATINSREFSIYFNAKKPPRLTKISSHLCPITSQLSRYRDPATGLPFADVIGYQEIRNLTEQKYTWSEMLGCYVGSATVAAKGVPEQFITGVKPQHKTEKTTTTGEANKDNEPERSESIAK